MLMVFDSVGNGGIKVKIKSVNLLIFACVCLCVFPSVACVSLYCIEQGGFCFLKHVGQMLAYDVASCLHSS